MQNMKEEFIKRYIYLYENASFILAPFVCKDEHTSDQKIYLKNMDDETLSMLEDLIILDTSLEDTELYKIMESNKRNKKYLEEVRNGLILLKEKNDDAQTVFKEKLDIRKLLNQVRDSFYRKNLDLGTLWAKKLALDEYYKVFRYNNDGMIWKSGYEVTGPSEFYEYKLADFMYKAGAKIGMFVLFLIDPENRNKKNNCVLSELEKQKIYLKFHNVEPYSEKNKFLYRR